MGRQEHRIERRLVAIFAADVAGYSRLMEQDEVGTLRSLTAHRAIMDQLIAEHGGRVANTAGIVSWPSSPVLSMPFTVPWTRNTHFRRRAEIFPRCAASNSGLGCMLAT